MKGGILQEPSSVSSVLTINDNTIKYKNFKNFNSVIAACTNKKRTFKEIRNIILLCLLDDKKSVNKISTETGINWKTVERHLIYLAGSGLITIIIASRYVKLVELSDKGREYVAMLNNVNNSEEIITKDEAIKNII